MRWSVQTCTLQGRRPSKRMKHLWLLPLIRPGIAAPQPPTQCTLIWFQTRNGLVWTVFGLVVDLASFAVHMSMLIPVACPFEYHGSGTEGTTHICILSILDLIYKLKKPWLHPSCIKNQLPRVRKQPCCMVRHRPRRFYMQKPALYHEYWKPPSCFHQGMAWQHDNRVKQRGKEKERSEWERGKEIEKAEQLEERKYTYHGMDELFPSIFAHWPFDSGKTLFEFAPRNSCQQWIYKPWRVALSLVSLKPKHFHLASFSHYIINASLWGLSIEVVSATKTNSTKIHALQFRTLNFLSDILLL